MEWKPSYGVFMDESYKLTYPDGQCKKRLTYPDCNLKRLTCLEVSEQKAQLLHVVIKKLLIQSVREKNSFTKAENDY